MSQSEPLPRIRATTQESLLVSASTEPLEQQSRPHILTGRCFLHSPGQIGNKTDTEPTSRNQRPPGRNTNLTQPRCRKHVQQHPYAQPDNQGNKPVVNEDPLNKPTNDDRRNKANVDNVAHRCLPHRRDGACLLGQPPTDADRRETWTVPGPSSNGLHLPPSSTALTLSMVGYWLSLNF